jgi:hypothetical protein
MAITVQEQVPRRIKRVRFGDAVQKPVSVLPMDDRKMKQLLKSISEYSDQMSVLASSMDDAKANLFKLMKVYQLPQLEDSNALAKIERERGREVNVVDIEAFRKMVSDEDFMTCIKISLTEAKKVLSGRELASITDTTPAKIGEEILVVVRK